MDITSELNIKNALDELINARELIRNKYEWRKENSLLPFDYMTKNDYLVYTSVRNAINFLKETIQ